LADGVFHVFSDLSLRQQHPAIHVHQQPEATPLLTMRLTTLNIATTATLNLSDAVQRAQISRCWKIAIKNLESDLGTNFSATTLEQL